MATETRASSAEMAAQYGTDPEKNHAVARDGVNPVDDASSDHSFKQGGVKKIEAITSVWSKKTMWLMFGLLFLVSFVDTLIVNVQGNLNPYVTSSFSLHSLMSTVGVLGTIIGSCAGLTIAKIIDVYGRAEGYVGMLLLTIVGLIMKATCTNVEMYAAAHTLYWTGHIGLISINTVLIADMTSLRNRMLMIGLEGTPNVVTTFAGPEISRLFVEESDFRWAFGAFAIILAFFGIPVVGILIWKQIKASQAGLLPKDNSGRTWFESVKVYAIQFDALGLLLITTGFVLFLLPFSIATFAPKGWASGYIIAMIVLGLFLLAVFTVWEAKFAPVQFMPWHYLRDRNILGASLVYGIMFISIFVWDTYYYSYLQVVHRLNVRDAGYVVNAFSLGSSFFSPFIGLYISYTGDYKWLSLFGIIPMTLGTALLIPYRTPETHVAVLVILQLLCGLGSGIFAQCGQLAVMASVTHQYVAVGLALWGMFGGIGAAVGQTVAGAMWSNMFVPELTKRLPADAKDLAATIYGDLTVQMSYADGDPIRDAIVGGYAAVQHKMVIVGACLMALVLASIFLLRNINVKKLEQDKGTQAKGTIF